MTAVLMAVCSIFATVTKLPSQLARVSTPPVAIGDGLDRCGDVSRFLLKRVTAWLGGD